MDQKARKRSTAVNSEAGISVKGHKEENLLPFDKEAALEETVKNLHEQVACLLCECNAKDELMAEHVKTTQEAITGREKAEKEVAIWKQELEDTLQHNIAAYERLVHLNASLKNCRIQLSCLKQEQDQWVNLERAHKRLESKYNEARRKLANLTLENALLTKALVKKEEISSHQMSEPTSDCLVLKKDLNTRTVNADVANWKHQEAANLEAERQRLRLLVKKRVPTKSVDKNMSLMIKKLSEVEEENRSLKESLSEKENEIQNLKEEIERILELENKIVSLELELDNLKLTNVDLDQQLSGVKFKLKEAFRKVSVLEMELEDKSQQHQGLETTCLDLQLQLATVSCKDEVNNKKWSPHSSLRDHMAADDGFHSYEELPNSLMIKEIISTCNNSFGVKNVVHQALPVVPWKKHVKGIELIRKLLFRRKRGGNKKKLHVFAGYHI